MSQSAENNRKKIARAMDSLSVFAERDVVWKQAFDEKVDDFLIHAATLLKTDKESTLTLLQRESRSWARAYQLLFEESLLQEEKGKASLLAIFLQKRGARETTIARRYLYSLASSELQAYEVLEAIDGKVLHVRNIKNQEEFCVTDRFFAPVAMPGSIVVTRLLDTGSKMVFSEGRILISSQTDSLKSSVDTDFLHMVLGAWALERGRL